MSGSGNPRRVRVASALRQVLADMLLREVKDPRVHAAGLISISHIELNKDMSVARVYVSFSGVSSVDDPLVLSAMAGLQAVAGFLRGPVGRRLKLRHSPSLQFIADDSAVFQQRLRELVRDDAARSHPEENDSAEPVAAETAAVEPAESDAQSVAAPTEHENSPRKPE